jgi:hypothetical protein
MTAGTGEGFLSRWSKRKQAAREGADEAADSARAPDAAAVPDVDADAAREERQRMEAENQAAAEAVDLETLAFDSDYSVFFKEGVSTQLKNAALRKLWRSNPVLACVDGLNDYDEDFRAVQTFAEGVRSSWQVGNGYGWMKEVVSEDAETVEAKEASSEVVETASGDREEGAPEHAAADADATETPIAPGDPPTDRPDRSQAAMETVPAEPVREARVPELAVSEERPKPARRRMRFQ